MTEVDAPELDVDLADAESLQRVAETLGRYRVERQPGGKLVSQAPGKGR